MSESYYKCHRCEKTCKSKGGLTLHLKSCISKIHQKKKKRSAKHKAQTVIHNGFEMVIDWEGDPRYKHVLRPGIYGGQYFASAEEAQDYKINQLIN